MKVYISTINKSLNIKKIKKTQPPPLKLKKLKKHEKYIKNKKPSILIFINKIKYKRLFNNKGSSL